MDQEMLYIQTIYQLGSFSKAARALYLSQPALSLAVQRVENKIGIPVFDRNCKPLQLTEAGRLYLEKASQIERLESELALQLQELKDGDSGELRIGATYYFTTRILPPVLGKYMRRYPQVKLTLLEGHSNKNLDLLREQSLDLAFACPGPDKDDFIHYPAFQDCIILAVPALYDINKTVGITPLNGLDVIQGRHLEESCPTVDLSKFSDVPWILLTEELDMYKRTEQFFNRAGYQPKVCLRVEQFITAYHLARAGIGATFLYDRCIQDASRDMCYYKVPYPESVRHLDMVLNRNRYVSRAARLFVSMLQEHYGSENC